MSNSDFAEQRETLVQSIESDQDDMRSALLELAGVTERSLDVAERIRRSPLAWAAAAFLLGAWFGARRNDSYETRRGRLP